MILIDTSVLSRVFRRKTSARSDTIADQLGRILDENIDVGIPGIVVQEILSGISAPRQFAEVRRRLDPFPIVLATVADHIDAAAIVNACRSRGVAVGSIDALIAALTIRRKADVFTLDRDFSRISEIVPLRLLPLAR